MLSIVPHDVNYIIFEYLDINELINVMLCCKTLKYDIENYCLRIKKQTLRKLINEYKCINCPKISYSVSKLCDLCIMDTCWECYTKSGNEFLETHITDENYIILKCHYGCKYKCFNCNFFYKKKYIKKDENRYKIVCIFCEDKNNYIL